MTINAIEHVTRCAALVLSMEGACINAPYVPSQSLMKETSLPRVTWPEIWFVATACKRQC